MSYSINEAFLDSSEKLRNMRIKFSRETQRVISLVWLANLLASGRPHKFASGTTKMRRA